MPCFYYTNLHFELEEKIFFFSIGGYLLKRIGDLRAVSVDD